MRSFSELVMTQRACRRFDPDAEVTDEDIATMVRHAVHAPSAENKQPWEFVVVRSAEVRHTFGAMMREVWALGGAEYVKANASPFVAADVTDGIAGGGLDTAPVLIVVCADLDKVLEVWAAASIYPATQNLLLAAASLGHGSCLTTGLTTAFADKVRELLALPATLLPMAGVYVGRPAKPLAAPRREPAEQHMHRERFGCAWVS
ncbi:MAG TPA: nitroreductase family protein [Mycobacteriales bacterium]|nr:nitroreductase family protein [Mycobacteriales bacterium]